jgi:hypothetical protein
MSGIDAFSRLGVYVERSARAVEERADDPSRWAIALSQAVPPALTRRLGIAEESSESWQGGVGPLTQPEAPPPPQTAKMPEEKGMLLAFDAGDLGQLKCWLEKTNDGMRVVVGVDGRNALMAAGAEKNALEAALKAAGLPVQSVSVVPLEKLGTVLADGERAPDGRVVRRVPAGSRDSSRPTRRVKWIG